MRRSLASQYRVKTAHHLLNIVALKREMDTYNVEGLLKAASTGHSKEACLRYAGLHAALLIEKRAVDFNNLFKAADGETPIPRGGYDSPYFGGSGGYPERPEVGRIKKPGGLYEGLAGMGNSISNAASSVGNSISNAAGGVGNFLSNYGKGGMTPEMRKKVYGTPGVTTLAAAPKFPRDGFTAGGSLKQQPYTPPASAAGSLQYNPNAPDPVRDAQIAASKPKPSIYDTYKDYDAKGTPATIAANAVAATPSTPTPASVIPKPAATGSADPFAANSAAYAKAQGATKPAKPAPAPEEGSNGVPLQSYADNERVPSNFGAASPVAKAKPQRAAKPSYTEDPVEAAYSKKLNQGAAQSAGRQQATNIASDVGNFMSNFGKTTANAVNSASNAMGGAKAPSTGYAASQSAYGASPAAASAPAQSDYDSQIAESQSYSDASKQQGDEDAYMKSIEPTAPTYPVSGAAGGTGSTGQEEVAQQSQPQQPQGRQTVIGSGAPLQAMQNNRQMRVQRRRGL